MIKIKPRPDLTAKYPAIDGIATPRGKDEPYECRTTGMMISRYLVETPAIRSDLIPLLKMEPSAFAEWLSVRRTAVKDRLAQLILITSIPQLDLARDDDQAVRTFAAYTQLSAEQKYLEEALATLEILAERYNEVER